MNFEWSGLQGITFWLWSPRPQS